MVSLDLMNTADLGAKSAKDAYILQHYIFIYKILQKRNV